MKNGAFFRNVVLVEPVEDVDMRKLLQTQKALAVLFVDDYPYIIIGFSDDTYRENLKCPCHDMFLSLKRIAGFIGPFLVDNFGFKEVKNIRAFLFPFFFSGCHAVHPFDRVDDWRPADRRRRGLSA